ncbi:hypothetical protein [Corallococcus carmarthensis]|uniref:hypothetical protein n=1 Tax=Corallococcus carmarthensis TaxID=2316728 RepID=UPI00148B89F7|nr:hypothetical protein [Corallococcus carmarthensis]NOK18869.1 hypothetical protein [Corallococcus carmarthensis]
MGPDSFDPDNDAGWYCINTNHVRCASDFYMYADSTPDGWCIRYDACNNESGPYVCGLKTPSPPASLPQHGQEGRGASAHFAPR